MTDPADLLQRVLADVADETPVEATSPDAIRAAAAQERRRSRRVAGLGALAAAVAIAAPVALLQRGDDTSAPVTRPSTSVPSTATPSVAHDQRLSLADLPLGASPKVAWLDQGVLVDADGTRTELPGAAGSGGLLASAVRFPGGTVTTDHRYFEGTQGLIRLGPDGDVVQECGTTGPAAVSALGDVAWSCVHLSESGEPGHHSLWIWSDGDLAEYPISGERPMPVVIGFLGRAVVYQGWYDGPVVLFRPGDTSRAPVPAIRTASDVDDQDHLIAGQGSPRRGVIVDPDTGAVRHDYPGWQLGEFSPDGSLITATPSDGGGALVVLDVATGQEVATLAQGSWQDVAWEDDSHVLIEVSRNDKVALVRASLDSTSDSTLERATPIRTPWGSLEIAAP